MAKVVSVEPMGVQEVYDLGIDEFHNFFANGVVVHNCMSVSRVLSGFTGPEANKLRKAIGKKLKDVMAEMKDKFIKGAQPKVDAGEIKASEVEEVWNQVESFAGYGFNKSHAICYSALSTAEMWLKYHYGVEFVTALINNTKPGKKKHGSENILVDYINYARRNGKEVLGPDVNKSGEEFTIDGGKIRFSLGHVKNVASAAPAIMSFQPFTSMEDFYNRVKMGPKEELEEKKDVEAEPDCIDEADEGQARSPEEVEEWKKMVLEEVAKVAKKRSVVRRPNKKVVESLIAAGAFDCFGSRNDVMKEYYRLRKNKKEVPSEYNEEQEVEREKEMLGICLSRPPIRKKHELLIQQKGWVRISDVADHASKKIRVFGMAENIRPHTSKAGNSMYIVQWTDGVDTMKFLVFQGGQQLFRDNFKVGVVGAVPLSKFDEGDTRFFDDNKICEMV